MQTQPKPQQSLRSFVDVVIKLAHEHEVERILQTLVEAAPRLLGAEVACAVLTGADGQIESSVPSATPKAVAGPLQDALEGRASSDEAVLAVALGGDRPIGALAVSRDSGEAFTDDDKELLEAMGSVAGATIEHARSLKDEARRAEHGPQLREIASRIRSSLNIDEVMQTSVSLLGQAAGATRCFIRLVTPSGDLGDVSHEWSSASSGPLGREDLSARIEWADELLGVVTLGAPPARGWTAADVEMLETAALELGIALHHGRLYEAALNTAQQLQDLDRLRTEFVSMVSHEVRSPMTVVAGIADLLQRRQHELTDDQRQELLDTLGREARRLTRLVSDVLDLEAIERGGNELDLSDVDLGALARETIIDAGEISRTKLRIAPGSTLLPADRDKVKQVLINLISNAAKFTPPGVPIDVEVAPEDNAVRVSVVDRGPGIPAEQQGLLFQPFSRLEAKTPGSGIGLYVSRALIERHGGRIWVDSRPGEGATFSFSLPR